MDALARIFLEAEALLFTAAGVFARVGAAAFLLPGLGERGVSIRLRLGAALALTLVLSPLVRPLAPATPQDLPGLLHVLGAEAVAGLVIGLAFRFLIYALQIAGTVAANMISIQHIFGSGVAPEPEPTIATFLAMGGIVLAMNAGLHVAVVGGLAELYAVLPFGRFPAGPDLAEWTTARVAETFALGVGLAFPFIALSMAYNIALGALSRAMPQLLVVLVGIPLLVGLGMAVLWIALPSIYEEWGRHLARVLADPLGGLG